MIVTDRLVETSHALLHSGINLTTMFLSVRHYPLKGMLDVKGVYMNTLFVKVGTVPGTLTDVAINEGQKVGDALEIAGHDAQGYDIRMDGETVTAETVIPATARVIVLVRQIKGNADVVMVKVGTVPGTLTDCALVPGAKVGDALELAGFSNVEGYDIRMDGTTVDTNTTIPADARVIVLVKQIKGN